MTTINNPELSLNHQQETLEKTLNADLQMLIIDAIERGIENDYQELRSFAEENKYADLAKMKAYLRTSQEQFSQETIKEIEATLKLSHHPKWQQKTREELLAILAEKEKTYQQARLKFKAPEVQFALDRIVKKSGIDEETVKAWLAQELERRMPNYQMLNQGLNYAQKIPLKPLDDQENELFSQLSSLFTKLRRNPKHPLANTLQEKKNQLQNLLKPFQSENLAKETISFHQLLQIRKQCFALQTLLQDWSYASHHKLSPSEEALITRAQQLSDLLDARYHARMGRFQDTKMAENYLRLQAMKKEQER